MKETVLTRSLVQELDLDKVSVITADMLKGYIRIGKEAFVRCTHLTSITIPDTITVIGDCAFYGCSGLASVVIPDSVTNIRCGAFYNCINLSSATIPDSVTIIGNSVFAYCRSLSSVTIGNRVGSIGNYAFYKCSSLTSITIPNSVKSIGNSVFAYCSGLTTITIPNSVKSIENRVFFGCDGLTSVTIGDKTYNSQTVTNGKCKAYKGFVSDMSCRGFQYEEGKTYAFEGKPELCKCGFHACLRLSDVFNYYYGKLGKNVVIHEVELEGVSFERNEFDSKVVAGRITIGKRIL